MPSALIHRHTPSGRTSRLAGVPRRLGRVLRAQVARRGLAVDRRDAPRILAELRLVRPDASTWTVQAGHPGEPTVLILGPPGAEPRAIVRVARSPSGQAGLDRAAASLAELHRRLGSLDVDGLLPVPLGAGALAGRTWAAESALPGHSARSLLGQPESRRRLMLATTAVIGRIHAATARPIVVDDVVVGRWVTARAEGIAGALERAGRSSRGPAALERVAADVTTALRARTLRAGWIHGDLWAANVLVTGAGSAISGIVDWDSAEDDELALHDRLHLAITTRRLVERSELGPVVAGLLNGDPWTDDDRAVLDGPSRPDGPSGLDGPFDGDAEAGDGLSGLPERAAVWLYWLRFVVANLARHPDLAKDREWLAANVEQVLACA